ncbi:MAG: hypothetical protein NT031_10765 [Planctomycetota bacterium]|nr:hypothetical protein [Planctomycetota bacterium]
MCGVLLAARLPADQAEKPADTNPAWNQAEIVFIGELTQAQTGPAVYLNQLTFKVEKILRGTLPDKTVSCAHAYRNEANFIYEIGKTYVVALTSAQDTIAVQHLCLADEPAVKQAQLACALPLGWTVADGLAISPWAGMGKSVWSAQPPAQAGKGTLACQKTGRPALLADPAALWTVEPVPPVKSIQWTNPDGDGEYKLTLTNPTDQPLTIPALLTQDGKILWRESIVILCQDKAYPCPGSRGVAGKVASLVLKPKESASTVVNALALQGPDWPQGGYRIEFTFCLGQKAKTMSFYYMARHHDGLRAALAKPAPATQPR